MPSGTRVRDQENLIGRKEGGREGGRKGGGMRGVE